MKFLSDSEQILLDIYIVHDANQVLKTPVILREPECFCCNNVIARNQIEFDRKQKMERVISKIFKVGE